MKAFTFIEGVGVRLVPIVEGIHPIVKRAAVFYAASYVFWGVILFSRLVGPLWGVIETFDPLGLALAPVLLATGVAFLSVVLSIASRRMNELRIVQIAALSGMILDASGYAIFGQHSFATLSLVAIHVTLLGFLLAASRRRLMQTVNLVCGIVLVFSWLGVPVCLQVDACGAQYSGVNPSLVIQDYKGFNITFYLGKYYAILQSEGGFDLSKTESHGYSVLFVGNSANQVEQLIDTYYSTHSASNG